MSLLKKLAGETAIYGLSSILGRLLNYVLLTPYLTRVFSTESYGIISDIYAYVALLMVIFTYRMETAFFRYASRSETKENAMATASVMLLVIYWRFGFRYFGGYPFCSIKVTEQTLAICWFEIDEYGG